MKSKLIKKLSKYAIDLSGDRDKLKQFIESKKWVIYNNQPLIDGYLHLDVNDNTFTPSDFYPIGHKLISIDDFIAKFSKSSCKQRVAELKAQLADKTTTIAPSSDWRDAFPDIGTKEVHAFADAIKIGIINDCITPQILCAYVATFKSGGFWNEPRGLYFVTAGIDSDPLATYEGAMKFIKEFKQ
jgi:hypothetical protein